MGKHLSEYEPYIFYHKQLKEKVSFIFSVRQNILISRFGRIHTVILKGNFCNQFNNQSTLNIEEQAFVFTMF